MSTSDDAPDYIDVETRLDYGKFANIASWLDESGRILQSHDYFEESRNIVHLGDLILSLTRLSSEDGMHDLETNEVPSLEYEPEIVALDGYGLARENVREAVDRYGSSVMYLPTKYLLRVLAGLTEWSSSRVQLEAREALRNGHQGMELVDEIKRFEWPTLDDVGRADRRGEPEELPDNSFLSDHGYSVAKDGPSRPERRDILKEVVGEYGLRAVARKITGLVLNRKRQRTNKFEAAIRKWESDLSWLKQRYYATARTDWRWPYRDQR